MPGEGAITGVMHCRATNDGNGLAPDKHVLRCRDNKVPRSFTEVVESDNKFLSRARGGEPF